MAFVSRNTGVLLVLVIPPLVLSATFHSKRFAWILVFFLVGEVGCYRADGKFRYL
ncbi:MAG: hypothetical protein ACO2OR_02050 [Desulfurococcaceae archaeon]